ATKHALSFPKRPYRPTIELTRPSGTPTSTSTASKELGSIPSSGNSSGTPSAARDSKRWNATANTCRSRPSFYRSNARSWTSSREAAVKAVDGFGGWVAAYSALTPRSRQIAPQSPPEKIEREQDQNRGPGKRQGRQGA